MFLKSIISILLLVLTSCSHNSKQPIPIDSIKNQVDKKNQLITFSKQDSINIDFEDEYVKYIVSFDYINWHGMEEGLVTDDLKFIKFYETPLHYFEQAKSLLKNDKVPFGNKNIICFSMNSLPLKERVEFLNVVYECYIENKVDDTHLSIAMTNNFGERPIIYYNYKDRDLQTILKRIKNDSISSENIKSFVSKIISGHQLKDHLEWVKKEDSIINLHQSNK